MKNCTTDKKETEMMDMRCSCWKRLVSFLLMNFHRKKDFRAKTNTLAI